MSVMLSEQRDRRDPGRGADRRDLPRAKGIIFHCDAAQATGKVTIDLNTLKCDLMSFSAHKTYGPKGGGRAVCPSQAACAD